jgi:hypothetical protein
VQSFELALRVALDAAFGPRVFDNINTRKWISSRLKCYERYGDKYLLLFKRQCNDLLIATASGSNLSRDKRGQVLPRVVIDTLGTKLVQYLKIRRALPLPSKPTVEKAKLDFIALATAPAVTRLVDPRVASKLRHVGKKHFFHKAPKVESRHLVSDAACAEYKRSEGGRTQVLSELGSSQAGFSAFEDTLSQGLIEERVSYSRRDKKAVDEYLWRNPLPDTVDMQVSMVAELGCKTRGVTKSPHRVVAEGHAYREALFPLLEADENIVTSEALRDPALLEISFRSKRKGPLWLYSADFSEATTRLSHEALALFCESFGVNPLVLYQGHTINGKPTTTGCPMGLPVSWTALSIIHYCVCYSVDSDYNYRHTGDDLVALWTQEQIDSFEEMSASVGLVVNDKTIKSMDFATFCEGDYVPERSGNGKVTLRRLPTFSIRSLVNNVPLAFSECATLISRGVPQEELSRLQKVYHKSWFHLCNEAGVNPFAPRSFGGLGLCSSLERTLDPLTTKIVNAAHNGTLMFHEHMDAMTRGGLTQRAVRVLSSVVFRADPELDYTPMFEFLSSEMIAQASFFDALGRDRQEKSKVLTPGKLVRSLAHFRRTFVRSGIASCAYPTSVGKAYEVMVRLGVPEESITAVTRPSTVNYCLNLGNG